MFVLKKKKKQKECGVGLCDLCAFAVKNMNEDIAIKVENVSKKYCKSLRGSMLYGMKDIARNSLGLSSNSHILRKDEFWAVDDVSFEVKKGETLGIIGANGAGKTTILKMLNGIFWPDKGKITIKGRVGALIAVGAGFHPMLTGRENIYLNGAILGMSRKEVNKKFGAIVEFADIGDFLDTPVKFYSSGMFVRLGFSVAVHCELDILLVDEVLAVGDLSFQNKSLRRLAELREKANAVVFVSHNLEHVRNLCDRVMVLDKAKIVFSGDTNEALSEYHERTREKKLIVIKNRKAFHSALHQSSGDIIFGDTGISDESGNRTEKIRLGETLTTFFEFETTKKLEELFFTIGIRDERNYNCIVHISDYADKIKFRNISKGKYRLIVKFITPNLVPGLYFPVIAIRNGVTNETYERIFDLKPFIIEGNILPRGIVHTESEWKLCPISERD